MMLLMVFGSITGYAVATREKKQLLRETMET